MLPLAGWPLNPMHTGEHYQTSFNIEGRSADAGRQFSKYSEWGFTIPDGEGQVGVRAKLLEVSLDQAVEGGTAFWITMQSLGSTPLLPLINTALQWKIHQAVLAVCFRKQAVPCLCSHSQALFMPHSALFVFFALLWMLLRAPEVALWLSGALGSGQRRE